MPTGTIGAGQRARSDALMKVAERGCIEFLMVSSQSLSENTHPKSIRKIRHSDSPHQIHGHECSLCRSMQIGCWS